MNKTVGLMVCLLMVLLSSGVQADQQWQLNAKVSKINFTLHSTLHDVGGDAKAISGSFIQNNNLINGVIDVGVNSLTTHHQARDQHMYQMFEAQRYPQIHFAFDKTNIQSLINHQDGEVLFTGVMMIHNISYPVNLLSRGRRIGQSMVFEGDLVIHLKDYALNPPSILGLIHVNNEVNVHYKMEFVTTGLMS